MTRHRLLPFVAAALLIASACATGASTTSEPDRPAAANADAALPKATTVHLPKSYKFEPKAVEVAKGAVVTWVNEDDFPHTVRLLDRSNVDKPLGVGDTTTITFDQAGVFRYDCSLHPTQMKGSVIVRDSSS